ncbi:MULTISPECIES: YciI family protein [unclassified Amycolatopsis]|uniref:YciI family protein n=1 Tax=unclassified Amycolatopsis TaxID=2618356 RepID=UPI0033BF04B7
MKYLLTINMTPALWDALPDSAKQDVYDGHGAFMKNNAAEFVETKALAAPAESVIVKVRDGKAIHETGLIHGSETFFCGYYVVDVPTKERAIELAAQVPEAKHTAVEVRPVVHEA